MSSLDKDSRLTGSSSLPVVKRVRQASVSVPTNAFPEELVNNPSSEERAPIDFISTLTPDGNLPTSQNLFELEYAMSRMKIYTEIGQTAVDQATAAADRACAAADRAVAAWDVATAASDAAAAARDAATTASNEAIAVNHAIRRQRRRVFYLINQWNTNMNQLAEQGITPSLN
ncbi:hypothetical protein BGX38DRAFT_1190004 [Terfezia claveryi]|nr:hypothetical protein BGX38DRAFT_1190004 [Terfezia claveryi]